MMLKNKHNRGKMKVVWTKFALNALFEVFITDVFDTRQNPEKIKRNS